MSKILSKEQAKQVFLIMKKSEKTKAQMTALLYRNDLINFKHAHSLQLVINKSGMPIEWVECFIKYFAQFDEDICRKLRAFLS